MSNDAKCQAAQKRLIAGENIINGQIEDVIDLAEELGVSQERRDALCEKAQSVKDALKAFHDEAEAGCQEMGITIQSGGQDK